MECPFCDYPKPDRHGKTSKGSQRYFCPSCPWCYSCNKSSNAHTFELTRCNADVASCVRYVGGHNRNVSSTYANVAGRTRYADCCIGSAGDRISNVLVRRSPATLVAPPVSFVPPLEGNRYAR